MSDVREDFWMRYCNYCLQDKLCPQKSVMKHFQGNELCTPVEALRKEHWRYLLSALSIDNSLTKVHFASCVSPHLQEDNINSKRNKRDKGFPTPYGRTEQNVTDICVAVAGLVRISQTLIILKLENLFIKLVDAQQLAVGLAESCNVKLLSFSGCRFEFGAVKAICSGLKRACITWLDLSFCALNPTDINAVADLIEFQANKRSNEMFPHTLRYNFPNMEDLCGINRISLNNNYIEDKEIFLLIESMLDDRFIKALDLQKCGIQNDAAMGLLSLASRNQSLEVMDLRLNDVEESIWHRITQQLALNKAGKTQTHTYSPLWQPSDMIRKYNAIGKGKVVKKSSTYKFRIIRKPSKSSNALHSVQKKSSKDASVQTLIALSPEKVEAFIEDLRRRLSNEMKLRKFLMSKYRLLEEEHLRLKSFIREESDNIYIDQDTYFDIKHTFEKLKIFFDVMKKYGLWEYISMLGFDETTDVVLNENDTLKSVKVLRKEQPPEEAQNSQTRTEPCCNCRKTDLADSKWELVSEDDLPKQLFEDCFRRAATELEQSESAKFEESLNENIAYTFFHEVMNDYNNASAVSHQIPNAKPAPVKKPNIDGMLQNNSKPSSSKLCASASSKAPPGAHMLIKKFSYSKMPKQFKEIVSPADFYNLVKRELEWCESKASKPEATTSYVENSCQTAPQTNVMTKVKVHTEIHDCTAPSNVPHYAGIPSKVSNEANEDEDDFENMPISELKVKLAKEAAKRKLNSKSHPNKKEALKALVFSLYDSKNNHKNANHAKSKEAKSSARPEHVLPKSKLKHSASSHPTSSETSSKKVPTRPNVSSDEINSSDGVITASDKLSGSSACSSSSSKSNDKTSSASSSSSGILKVKTPDASVSPGSKSKVKPSSKTSVSSDSKSKTFSGQSENEHQKSYIESVSDASTFKDVESISDIEVVSAPSLSSGRSEKVASGADDKSVFAAKAKDRSVSSSSSTLKNVLESKDLKPDETTVPRSLVKGTASDSSTKTKPSHLGKTKNANKQSNKSRPKSNSSKSSSVPSLSDITTVSSHSLNTDSVMKRISGSEGNSRGEN